MRQEEAVERPSGRQQQRPLAQPSAGANQHGDEAGGSRREAERPAAAEAAGAALAPASVIAAWYLDEDSLSRLERSAVEIFHLGIVHLTVRL